MTTLRGTLTEDEGRRDYPDTLLPAENDGTYYVVRLSDGSSLLVKFTTRKAAETVAHQINVYGSDGDVSARVIRWQATNGGAPYIPTAL